MWIRNSYKQTAKIILIARCAVAHFDENYFAGVRLSGTGERAKYHGFYSDFNKISPERVLRSAV